MTSPKLPPVPYTLTLGSYTLEGSLDHLYRHGQIYFHGGTLSAPDRLAALLEHLIFCAVRPSETECCQTYILTPEKPETFAEIPQQQAAEALLQWLEYYHIGQNRPLPFFPRVQSAAAKEWLKTGDQNKAVKKARAIYHGDDYSAGQKTYPEVAQVFGNSAEDPTATALFWNLTENLLAPLLAATGSLDG